MPIATLAATLNALVMFAQEGLSFTVPTAGTVSESAKPGAADQVWLDGNFGPTEDLKPAPESEDYELMGGVPGGLVRLDVIPISKKLTLTWGNQKITPRVLQLIFGSQVLSGSSTQSNPLAGNLVVKGWLKLQTYTPAGTHQFTQDYWGALKVTEVEPWSGANVFKAKFEFRVLHNNLNSTLHP